MPKFGTPDEEPAAPKPAMDMIPPATKGAAAAITTNVMPSASPAPSIQQLSPEAQMAKIEMEKKSSIWKKLAAKGPVLSRISWYNRKPWLRFCPIRKFLNSQVKGARFSCA
jgi:hypothetical protein